MYPIILVVWSFCFALYLLVEALDGALFPSEGESTLRSGNEPSRPWRSVYVAGRIL
jgi:hypothetical protein